MKKLLTATAGFLLITGLSGCNYIGGSLSGISIIYSIAAVLSAILLLGVFSPYGATNGSLYCFSLY